MTFRFSVPAALAAIALLAAGCGDNKSDHKKVDTSNRGYSTSGTQLTASQWRDKLQADNAKVKDAASKIATANKDDLSPVDDAIKSIGDVADDVANVNPPTKLQSINATIAHGYGEMANALQDIRDDIAGNDKDKAQKDLQAFQKVQTGLQESIAKGLAALSGG
jgi:hypothetical protein